MTEQSIEQGRGPVRVLAVTSGKGGVGKTSVSINLATAFAQMGRQPVILDADLGLANVDVALGLQPRHNLSHVFSGERTLEEIIVDGPGGVRIIPASSGVHAMAQLSRAEHAGLIRAFSDLSAGVDVLLVDSAAGISDSVISFCRAAQDVLVVVCDEPASITDAYALIKLLNREHGVRRFRVVANRVPSAAQGEALFRKMVKVTDRFLDEVILDYVGAIPEDEYLRKAVSKQRAVVAGYPGSKAARAFCALVEKIDRWPIPYSGSGELEFFIERLVRREPADELKALL